MEIKLTQAQREKFKADGFIVVESVLNDKQIDAARARFEPLFRGEFETGIQPDEWNWQEGKSSPDLTRQICNGWKSDRTIASMVLRTDIGKACAEMHNWPGARINQDNVIWKPPGAKALGFHQDASYQQWIVPSQMMSCWMTLDDTHSDQGTIEYVRGSHLWPVSAPIEQFHAPEDPQAEMRAAAKHAGIDDIDSVIVPIEVAAGSAVFHHGNIWHGSGSNESDNQRRSLVSHCCSSSAQFHHSNDNPIYSRYRQRDTLEMNESFFPILWQADGTRSAWLEEWLR